jgi:transposase
MVHMIVIGADTHKASHALAAVDAGTGRVRGSREIKAEEPGHLAVVRWARGLDEDRVWAIEDCRHVSRRLEQALVAAGERVVRVPPHRMGASRKGERERGKSDEIDALAVARAVVKDGVEKFPVAYLNERAMEIRLLLDHRGDLVAERTRIVNRLRWHLLELCPELERSLKRGSLSKSRPLDRVERALRKLPVLARGRIAREQVSQVRRLTRQIDALHRELEELVKAHRPALLDELGCGALTAAILIGHTAGNERFRSDASFALLSGTAPIPCSSGQRTQHRLNRGGDRQLNHALHIIAITRAHHDPATREYVERKEAEGKTSKGALRCLKRHLARRFHRLLAQPPADQQQTAEPDVVVIPPPRGEVEPNTRGAAPSTMVCIG